MESNEQILKTPKSSRHSGAYFAETPLLSTPRPQASSTVERRSLIKSPYSNADPVEDRYRRYDFSTTGNSEKAANMDDSSLGILNNLSSFLNDDNRTAEKEKPNYGSIEDERELARKLLQRCSDIHFPNLPLDTNKENNANSPNMSSDKTRSTLVNSAQSFNLSPSISREQSTLKTPGRKISNVSVNFEPNEITARSSAMSRSMESKRAQSPAPSTGGISYSSANAELAAQFDDEDFQSGSRMASQLLADEISWQQNASYGLPVATSTEKEHLELSCFSGIIGDLDLTVESCAGRRVSVGEYFRRKCGNMGELAELDKPFERPNFGHEVRSPKRGANVPLIDTTSMTEDSTTSNEKDDKLLASFSDTTKEQTIMSLSTIAQTLQDLDNDAPRRLVDQLFMALKKKKKCPEKLPENLTSNTYTLPAVSRSSLPACSANSTKKFENEISELCQSTKLSLDSKTINRTSAFQYQNATRDSLASTELGDITNSQADSSLAEIVEEKLKFLDVPTINVTNSYSQNTDVKNFSTVKQALDESLKNLEKPEMLSTPTDCKTIIKTRRETESPRKINNSQIKKEEISAQRSALEASVLTNTPTDHSSPNEHVRISKNTLEQHNCVIGIRRDVDVEFENKCDRWIICSLTLSQIQGDKDNIELEVTPKVMLLPDASKTLKIGVKVPKPGKPIIAALNVQTSEIPTRVTCRLQHIMCFVPEELNIVVSTQSEKNEIDFESLCDRFTKTIPVGLENRNSVDVPIMLSIVNNEHNKFALESPDDRLMGSQRSHDNDSMRLLLKPSEKFKANIRYNSLSDTEKQNKEATSVTAKLVLSTVDEQKREQDLIIKEIPIIGTRATPKSTVMPAEKPNDYLRCDTPQQQHLGSISSPTSPHSSASNRSGISGRNSPHSSVSGGTVAGDVIPIRATHATLAWNSIKVGKNDTKEFTIRNTSTNKIKLQATIVDNDNSFKFLRDRQQFASHIVLGLQRMESRTFSIVFSPNNPGAAAGRIVFKHYEPKSESSESRPTKVISLYGYGGVGKVEISEAFKDTASQLWLSLGSLNSGGTLDAKIKLQNTGDLCSYAKIKLTPKAVYPAMVSSWSVDPTELLLGPKEVRWVTLEFRPRKEDIALLKRSNVSHVGTLTIAHGDEPTRLRIRRLYKKLSQTGQMSGKDTEAFRNVVYPIIKVFPGEVPLNDLRTIRDSVENLSDLCRGVLQHEVMLTMEVNADESMSMLHDNADESQMFYSLRSDDSNVFPATEESFMPSETLMDCTVKERIFEEDFSVTPSRVTLTPPSVSEATVMIMSSSNVAQPFETAISCAEYLCAVPAEGMIPTRRGFPLRIQCKKRLDRNIEAVLQVYTANEKREVQIKVLFR